MFRYRNSVHFVLFVLLSVVLLTPSYAQLEMSDDAISDSSTDGGGTYLDTLDIRDMDINDCLKLLAQKSGLNIIAGKSITGRVTIFLQNVKVMDALTIILKANDLAYIQERGVFQIVTGAEYEQMTGHKFGVNTKSVVMTLNSAKPSDVVAMLNQVKSTQAKIVANDESSTIIIEEVPERLELLKNYIKSMDIQTKQKVFDLKYVSVEVIAPKIQEMLSPKIGNLKFDAPSNKLFIKDSPERIKEIENFIAQIDQMRQSRVFTLSYTKVEDLAKTITPMLSKDIGSLQFDIRSNTLVVTDIPPRISEMSTVIEALDRKDKEVLIEAKIVQITLNDSYQMGINWEKVLPNSDHKVVSLKNDFSLAGSPNPVSLTTIGTLSRDDYSVALQMISTMGKSRLLSNPRIAVVNNQDAKILVGTSTPYVTNSVTTPATGPSTTSETVNFIDTGVKLHVTPNIHDDGFVTIHIKPEVSNIPKSITTSVNNQIPVKDTSEVDTTIRVKDGVTIILGGLIKDELRNTKNKIPVLGDLPMVGKVFRNESRSIDKTEIVIFLTPHIITGDVHQEEAAYGYETSEPTKTYDNPLPRETTLVPLQ